MSKATRLLRILSIAIAVLLGVVGVGGGTGILLISLLYEATTNAVGVNVDVSVYELGTTKPVSDCLLSFSQGVGSSEQHSGARTDASGHLSHRQSYAECKRQPRR